MCIRTVWWTHTHTFAKCVNKVFGYADSVAITMRKEIYFLQTALTIFTHLLTSTDNHCHFVKRVIKCMKRTRETAPHKTQQKLPYFLSWNWVWSWVWPPHCAQFVQRNMFFFFFCVPFSGVFSICVGRAFGNLLDMPRIQFLRVRKKFIRKFWIINTHFHDVLWMYLEFPGLYCGILSSFLFSSYDSHCFHFGMDHCIVALFRYFFFVSSHFLAANSPFIFLCCLQRYTNP